MDSRFSKVYSDPKFRTLKKKDKKLKIDNRFKSMFSEDKFKLKFSMDKRGKSNKRHMSEDYKRFYRLSDEEDNKDDDEDEDEKEEEVKQESEDEPTPLKTTPKGLTHQFGYHRGMKDEDDDSSSSSSESEDEGEGEDLEHEWNELDRDAKRADDTTRRVAICNADWDRFNAQDIFVLLNSFKPSTGVIHSVKVFYSKFGEERLKIEETKGPSQFIYGKGENIEPKDEFSNDETEESENSDEDEEEQDSNMEKLRKYQLERLKYFYAVVECDTAETADAIYKELDGMEYESSATTLDLRFVPDEMDFDDVKLKAECSSMPNSNYKPPEFINTALQQSQVKLTWDETDPRRKQIFEKAFEKEHEDDLQAYLATSSEDEDGGEGVDIGSDDDDDMKTEDQIAKYKNLLSSLDKKEDDMDMEITWDPTLKDKVLGIENKEEDKKSSDKKKKPTQTEESDNSQQEDGSDEGSDGSEADKEASDEESPEELSEDEMEKPKVTKKPKFNKKKSNKFEETELDSEEASKLKLLMMDMDDNNNGDKKKHFNYKDIVNKYSKNQKVDEDDFKFNAEDPRFGAIYNSHHYNVDQSDPNFKRTDAFKQIIDNKKKRGASEYQPKVQAKPEPSWKSLAKKVKHNVEEKQQQRIAPKMVKSQNKFRVDGKFKR